MKALGIVRKIDDLGRVVIPKEVRKVNGWESGTPVEIFATEDGVFIREYKSDFERQELIQQMNDVLNFTQNETVKQVIGRALEFVKKG
jgi:AbrB family transcriptional regulator, stage V sporulation protein T